MAIIVTVAEVMQAVPTITAEWALIVTDGVNAQASRKIPELAMVSDWDTLAESKLVIMQAVRAFALNSPWLQSQASGPYQVAYRQRVGSGVLTISDIDQLRGIVGQVAAAIPGPLGSFPDPPAYGDMWHRPGGVW